MPKTLSQIANEASKPNDVYNEVSRLQTIKPGVRIVIRLIKMNHVAAPQTQLMCKTAVFNLVIGDITHQKQQISEKGDITQHHIA